MVYLLIGNIMNLESVNLYLITLMAAIAHMSQRNNIMPELMFIIMIHNNIN